VPPRKPQTPPTSVVETLPGVLRDARLRTGLSIEALAQLSGVHYTVIGRAERGVFSPSLATLEALARGLDCAPSDLLLAAETATKRRAGETAGKRRRTPPRSN
jgi:transcriptional regulator with XRE-family HTH domain